MNLKETMSKKFTQKNAALLFMVSFALVIFAPSVSAAISIALNTPVDGANSSALNINYTFTPVISGVDTAYSNCSLWTNASGVWAFTGPNESAVNDTGVNGISYTFATIGKYLWGIQCFDNASVEYWNDTNRTIAADNVAPLVVQTTPVALANVSGTIVINTSITDSVAGVNPSSVLYWIENASAENYTTWANLTATGSNYSASFVSSSVPDGTYNITINATDYAGNQNATTKTTVLIDNTKPTVAFANPGADNMRMYSSYNFTVTIVDTGSSVSTVKLRNGTANTWVDMTSAGGGTWYYVLNLSVLPSGYINISVNATDYAGNYNETTYRQVLVDSAAPTITHGSPIDYFNSSSGTIDFNFTVGDDLASNLNCSIYYDAFINTWSDTATGSINFSSSAMANGTKLWNVTCYDKANSTAGDLGNANSSASWTFTIDTENSTIVAVTPASGSNHSSAITVNASITDTYSGAKNASFAFTNSSGANVSAWMPMSMTSGTINSGYWNATATPPADGYFNISIIAYDHASNPSFASITNAAYDTTAPTMYMISPENNSNHSTVFSVNASVNDTTTGVLNVTYRALNSTNTTSWQAMANSGTPYVGSWAAVVNFTSLGFSDGTYTLQVNATDYVGQSTYSENITVRYDTTKPSVAFIAPVNGYNYSGTILLNVSASDTTTGAYNVSVVVSGATSSLRYLSLTSGTANAGYWSASFDTTTATDGAYTLTINSTDYASNVNSTQSITINIDNAAPFYGNIVSPSAGANTSQNVTITIPVYDVSTGANATYFRFNSSDAWKAMTLAAGSGTNGNWTYSYNTTQLADGVYNITFNATDYAGNNNATTPTLNLIVDNTAPLVFFNTPNATYSNSSTRTFNFTVVDSLSGPGTCAVYLTGPGTAWSSINSSSSITTGVANVLTYVTSNAGAFAWNVLCNDSAGNSGWNATNYTAYYDNRAPMFTATANGSTTLNVTAQEAVNVSVALADTLNGTAATGNLLTVNVSISYQSAMYACYYNASVGASSVTAACAFTPNQSGTYSVVVSAVDQATNVNSSSSAATFTAYNGMPVPAFSSGISGLLSAAFKQKRSNYTMEAPQYENGTTTLTTSGWANPTYLDNVSFPTSNVFESLAYNYSFSINFSSNATQYLNLSAPGSVPANVSTFTVYSPAGQKNITMIAPDFSGSAFTIYYNNTAYQSTNTSAPIYGNFSMQTGLAQLTIANGSTTTPVPVSIMFSTSPPINITSQIITGFTRTSPPDPTTGELLNTSYYMALLGGNEYYAPENMTVSFLFPQIVSFNGTNKTILGSNYVTLQRKVSGGNWTTIANATWFNTTLVSNYSDSFAIADNITGSPTNGQTITVYVVGYKYKLDGGVRLGWKNGDTIELNASASLNFTANDSGSLTPGTAGSTNNYTASIVAGTTSGILIPTSKLPGLTGNITPVVILNGRTLTASQYSVGSITVTGAQLSSGANTLQVNYVVPSTTTTVSGTGAGAGEDNPTQTVIFSITAGQEQTLAYTDPEIEITDITLTTDSSMSGVKLSVTSLGTDAPTGTPTPSGSVYSYLTVEKSGFTDEHVTAVTIGFRVPESWFANNGFDPETTSLQRLENGVWTSYVATQTKLENGYYYFEVEVPGLSTFVITASALPTAPECSTNAACDDSNACTNDACSNGVCSHSNVADGTACEGGACASGACVIGTAPVTPPITPTQFDPKTIAVVVAVIVVLALAYVMMSRKPRYPISGRK